MSASKPGLLQDLAWRLQAAGYVAAQQLVRVFPVDWVSDFGGWVFRHLGPLTSSQKVVDRNLRLAFPDLDPEAKAKIVAEQWDQLGRTFIEFFINDRLTPASGRVEVVNAERLDEIAKSGKPVVFVSGHFSNWEIMPLVIVQSGVPCEMTYRAANNPYVDKLIRDARARYGVKLFAPKGSDGSRELLAGMKEGRSVALMNDQKFNGGAALPFMGHLAHTAVAPTRLALRFDTVLQPMSVQRTKGAHFRVVVHEPISLDNTGHRDADLKAGVEKVNAFMEARLREAPSQWFWVHRRWSNEAYASLKAS